MIGQQHEWLSFRSSDDVLDTYAGLFPPQRAPTLLSVCVLDDSVPGSIHPHQADSHHPPEGDVNESEYQECQERDCDHSAAPQRAAKGKIIMRIKDNYQAIALTARRGVLATLYFQESFCVDNDFGECGRRCSQRLERER